MCLYIYIYIKGLKNRTIELIFWPLKPKDFWSNKLTCKIEWKYRNFIKITLFKIIIKKPNSLDKIVWFNIFLWKVIGFSWFKRLFCKFMISFVSTQNLFFFLAENQLRILYNSSIWQSNFWFDMVLKNFSWNSLEKLSNVWYFC